MISENSFDIEFFNTYIKNLKTCIDGVLGDKIIVETKLEVTESRLKVALDTINSLQAELNKMKEECVLPQQAMPPKKKIQQQPQNDF